MQLTIDVPDDWAQALDRDERDTEVVAQRAIALYVLLENPDEVLDERGVMEVMKT